MYQFPLKQMTTKSRPKRQNKALHILILASCYTIAQSFQLRHFIKKWNPNPFFILATLGSILDLDEFTYYFLLLSG